MISIIICHRNKALLNRISKNIAETIGVDYELVIIDNTLNNYSIFSAYNTGVKRASYEIICFTHEDVLFYTNDWGKRVVMHFNDNDVGMIGVTGGTAQSIVPGAWWYNNYFGKSATNLIMSKTKKPGEQLQVIYNNPFTNTVKTEVVIIDGLWFCIRKILFQNIRFDDKTFDGYHMYDADISMQVGLYSKRYVVYDIFLQHVWNGHINSHYYNALQKFTLKWQNFLPVYSSDHHSNYVHLLGWHTLRSLVLDMKKSKMSSKDVSFVIDKYQGILNKNYQSNWFRLYFLLSRIFGFRLINSLFFRVEQFIGFAKLPGHTKRHFPDLLPKKIKGLTS